MKKSIKKSSGTQGVQDEKKSIKIQKSEKLDSANLSKIKKDASKEEIRNGNLYLHFAGLSSKDQKKERSKLRRKLENFRSNILGMDRKKEEREVAMKEFIAYYRKNWRIQDFKFESFSNQKDPDFKRDFEKILSDAKTFLEKKK